jgi:hypothetical protein
MLPFEMFEKTGISNPLNKMCMHMLLAHEIQ